VRVAVRYIYASYREFIGRKSILGYRDLPFLDTQFLEPMLSKNSNAPPALAMNLPTFDAKELFAN
jgi:hypothetical protein